MPSSPELVAALPIILSLILIEGLLSIDNSLAIAAMASHLPGRQKLLALRLGLIGAYFFRGVALAFAQFIIENPWLKLIGAAYLIHLMAAHFAKDEHPVIKADVPEIAAQRLGRGFWSTVFAIELMDFSLSVDNVVAAVAMSPKLWIVCTGVFIGILTMRFVAGYCIQLIEKFPILGDTAFLLIGFVGGILVVELTAHVHISAAEKFFGICGILALSLLYSKSAGLQRALALPLKIARWPLVAYAAVSNRIFGLLTLPVHLVLMLFKKKAPERPQ